MQPLRSILTAALATAFVLALSACGGSSSKSAAASPSSGGQAQQVSSKTYDLQTVEGCFLSAGNIHDLTDQNWFDIVNLGNQARNQGQGAFSTFSGSSFDTAAYYFFNSHDQAEQMLKRADKKAHDPARVYVVGNVVAADYESLNGPNQQLQSHCLG